MHHPWHSSSRWLSAGAVTALLICSAAPALGAAAFEGPPSSTPRGDDLEPQTPGAFLPDGMLGIQLGGSWQMSKQSPSLHQ